MSGTVLVAGGAGLLGSRVALALAARGDRVAVADRFGPEGDGPAARAERARSLVRAGIPVVRVDVRDPQGVARVLGEHRPSAVVHAYRIDDASGDPAGFLGRLLPAAKEAGVGYLVHLSDAALYGPPPAPGRRASEEEPVVPGDDPVLLARAAEEEAVRGSGIAGVVFRVFELIGPSLPISRFPMEALEALLAGDEVPPVDGTPRDYLHVDDAARGVLLALDRRPAGVLNLGSGMAVSPRTVVERIADRVYRPLRFAGEPASPADGAEPRIADVERVFATLGFSPTRGLEEILGELVTARLRPPAESGRAETREVTASRPAPVSATPAGPVSRRDLLGLFRRR